MLQKTPAAQCPWLGGNDADIIGSSTATLKAFRLSTTNARRGSALSMAGASSASKAAGRTPSAKACPTTPPSSFGASGASMLRQDAAAGQSPLDSTVRATLEDLRETVMSACPESLTRIIDKIRTSESGHGLTRPRLEKCSMTDDLLRPARKHPV